MPLTGKVALVTGASRGLGQAILLRLAKEGALAVGTATTEAGADAITAKLADEGYKGHGFVLDVTNQASMEAMLAEVQLAYGLPAILVNNAGVRQDNLLLRMSDDEWMQVIETNLNSIFRLSKACVKGMLKNRWGRIISISSIAGISGNPGQANYSAAKAGVIGFSKSLAQEIASRNITVNVVAPGFINTDMTRSLTEEQKKAILPKIPMGRVGEPEEIAAAVAFLASDEAAYITGVTLHVNGGMYMA
ncbi:MAG TPA: 3-oxoacyl-ACP reductase FabG [Gammaproteobacteria bacterium]|nr:3-oxoacyl-ACP reductase FabG [Gammaproteobacteria bacterium]